MELLKLGQGHLKARHQARLVLAALIIILLGGLALRLYHLDFQSLWNDEFWTWESAILRSPAAIIDDLVNFSNHPPANHILIHYVISVFGDSETALRMPAVISGVLVLLGVFFVGRYLFSDTEGLIAAALMAVSRSAIYYSQEARANNLMLATLTWATYFWLKIMTRLHRESKVPTSLALTYGLLALLACYLHYFSLLFVGLQGILSLVSFIRRWRSLKYLILLYTIIGLLYLPWLPNFLAQMSRTDTTYGWVPLPTLGNIPDFLRFVYAPSTNLTMVMLGLVIVAFGIRVIPYFRHYAGFPRKSTSDFLPLSPALLLVLWLIVPFVVTYAASLLIQPMLVNRNLIYVLPAGYLLVARAINILPFKLIPKLTITGLLVGWLLYRLIFTWNYYDVAQKEQFREVAQFVGDNNAHYDDPLLVANILPPHSLDYYFSRSNPEVAVDLLVPSEAPVAAVTKAMENSSKEYLWYVNQEISHNIPELLTYLEQNLTLIDQKKFVGLEAYLFRRKADQ